MIFDAGTPMGFVCYDGTAQYPGGGYAIAAQGASTFPAIPDPAGLVPVTMCANCNYLNPYGPNGGAQNGIFAMKDRTSAQNYLNSLIAANPSGSYNVGYPGLTSSPKTFSNVTRTIGTAFQISTSQDSVVSYAVDVSINSAILGNAQGTVTLQYADDAAFTTNVKTLMSGTNSTSGVLNLANIGTVGLAGVVPASKYVKVTATTVSGTPTFTMRPGQEVLM